MTPDTLSSQSESDFPNKIEGIKNSSMMHSIYYDRNSHLLFIRFKSNPHYIYRYYNVPHTIEDFIISIREKKVSPGTFFHRYIKNVYKFQKIEFKEFEENVLKALEEKQELSPMFLIFGKR